MVSNNLAYGSSTGLNRLSTYGLCASWTKSQAAYVCRFIRINRRSLNYWTDLGDNSIRPIGRLGQLFWLEYIKAARLLLLCRSFLLLRNIACLRLVVYWPFYLQVDLSTSSFGMILYLLEAVEVTRDRNSRIACHIAYRYYTHYIRLTTKLDQDFFIFTTTLSTVTAIDNPN